MKFLDSSVPLAAMLDGDKHSEAAKEIMAVVESGNEKVITSPFTIAEIYHILTVREKRTCAFAEKQLVSLLDCAGLELADASASLSRGAVEVAAKFDIDFIDAFNKSLMDLLNIKEIYSFDKHFDRFKGIKRYSSLV